MCKEEKGALPAWLLVKDNYVPEADKERFLQKTTMELMGKLTFLNRDVQESNWISIPGHLFTGLLLVILIVASTNLGFPLAILTGFILYLVCQSGSFILDVLKPAVLGGFMGLLLIAPSWFLGNKNLLFIPIKIFVTILVFSYLTKIIPFGKIVVNLGYFKVPAILILIISLTINYIVLLGRTALSLLEAIKLRSVGKNSDKYNSLAGVMGVTFLKAQSYGEETYQAMLCRGFDGHYQRNYRWNLSIKAVWYLLFNIIVITLYFALY